MDNRIKLQKGIEGLQRIRTWQLVVIFILVAFIAATFLRLNSVGMVQRRDAVIVADQAGDDETTLKRLYDLQHYVSSHMNTDLGRGVYLEAGYSRDTQEWQKGQYGGANPNGNIYKKAQEVCAPRFSSYSQAYLECTTNELAKYPAGTSQKAESSKPPQAAYIHSFSSPIWSPDFAGWSVLLALVILGVIAIRLIAYGILKLMLKRHYAQV